MKGRCQRQILPTLRLLWPLILPLMLVACSQPLGGDFTSLNSRYTDQQPALSGDGKLLAFITDRAGRQELVVYNLEQRQFVPLPGLNQGNGVIESPSLSRTGRYIVYLSSRRGRPEIELYDRFTRNIDILTIGYPGWVRHPRIDPDGRYITFESAQKGQWDIEIFDRGQGVELDLAPGTSISPPLP
jgi:Tol biopolymer transport system component